MSSEFVAYLSHALNPTETQKSVGTGGSCGSVIHPSHAGSTVPDRLTEASYEEAESSDTALLNRVSQGEKNALSVLFRRYARPVLSVARRILRDECEAEDLCQDVFLYLFEKAKHFDARKGSASSWIIQIAYHRAINRRRYLTFRRHYDAEELSEENLDAGNCRFFVNEVVTRTLLNRIREQLSSEQQRTLELHFFEGYSLREIAEKTGEALGNVRHHYYRGLERLRSCVFPEKDI